jgi:hypothetical protein
MLRNSFLFLVLAVLAATAAVATPTRLAKAHRRAPAKVIPHLSSHRAGSRALATPPHAAPVHASRRPVHGQLSHSRRIENVYSAPVRQRGRARFRAVSFTRTRTLPGSPIKGSLESLTRQNERAEADGLERILDEDDLANRIAQGLLVPVPTSSLLTIDATLPDTHKYCRPWTATFLTDLAEAHANRFRHALFVSSAVRTVEYQEQLTHYNGNAAAAEGDIVSPHLTGGTIDIAKNGMSRSELAWMRNWLLAQQLAGMIDVEEEFRQPCFHITVYRNYTSPAPEPLPGRRAHPRTAAVSAASDPSL